MIQQLRFDDFSWDELWLIAGTEIMQHLVHDDEQLRHLFFNHIPDDFEFNAKLLVNKYVPHACQSTPWNLRARLLRGVRQMLDRFTEDLKVSYDRVLGFSI